MKKYPISEASIQALVYAAAIAVVVEDSQTILEVSMTGDLTLSLDSTSTPQIGDRVIVKATSDATARDVTFGTGFTAPVLSGVIAKTLTQEFVYDGSAFISVSSPVQID